MITFVMFCSLCRAVRFAAFLMRKVLCKRKKATILFATETGRSEGFARNLAKLLSHALDVKVCSQLTLDIGILLHIANMSRRTLTGGNSLISKGTLNMFGPRQEALAQI